MMGTSADRIAIDGRAYELEVRRVPAAGRPDVSIAIASHEGRALTELAVDSIARFARGRYEIWVVDNASGDGTREMLLRRDDCNVVLNRTPAWIDELAPIRRLLRLRPHRGTASYSNAIALEIALRYASGRWLFVMHNDCIVADDAWMPFMLSKVGDQVRGVAMSVDRARVHAMHSSGFLVDRELVAGAGLSFLPDLPRYDVGDAITIGLRALGFAYHVCPNTFNRPETVERVPPDHPLRSAYCDRAFDDDGRVIFAHLGRGTLKAAGRYAREGKTDAATWLALGRRLLGAS